MNGFLMLNIIEFKLYFRNFMNVFFALVFPIMMVILFGAIYGNEPVDFFNGRGTVDVSVPAYACIVIAVTGLMSLPITVSQYREKKILKRFMATPINPADILISQIIVNFIMSIIGLFLLIAIAKIIFNIQFFGHVLSVFLAFIITTLSIFSMGLLIASISPNSKTSNIISYLVYFPMLFLSGATLPMEMMPKSIVMISKALPLSYGVNLLKGVWLGDMLSSHIVDIVVLTSVFIICTTIALVSFKWDSAL